MDDGYTDWVVDKWKMGDNPELRPLLSISSTNSSTSTGIVSVGDMGNQDTRTGRLRAYWLGSVVCMGGFLCGYDSGM